MSSITIGGIGVDLTDFSEGEREVRGEAVRAFDNTLLNGTDARKRVFSAGTDWMDPDDADDLLAVIDAGNVVCSGVVLPGGSVLCMVTARERPSGPDVHSAPSAAPDWTATSVRLSLTLREV